MISIDYVVKIFAHTFIFIRPKRQRNMTNVSEKRQKKTKKEIQSLKHYYSDAVTY